VVLVVVIALLGRWISSLGSPPLMSLDFLKGRAVTANIEYDPRKLPFTITCASGGPAYHSWIQYYSFEADFSDLCKAADAELLALGFKAGTLSRDQRKIRVYSFSKATSSKVVYIYEKRRFVKSLFSDDYTLEFGDGCVTVKISRRRLPLWPPRYLLYRLKRFSQVVTGR
jgi:hypothetical protein